MTPNAPQNSTHDAPMTRRQRLILAGRRLFAEKGYSGTGVREIAAEAGVSIGLIRTHFGSKEGLRQEIDRHVLAQIEELYAKVNEHSGTQALEHVVEDAVEWIERESDALMYVRTALMERTPGSQRLFSRLLAILRGFVEVNKERGFLQDGVDEEWAALYLVFDFLGPAVIEPFSDAELGASMYSRKMVERRNAFMRRVMTRGFMKA